jgi:hypothetical protein
MSAALIDDMGVANVGFLIENLGKDAGELQFLRELVQNSLEAIINADRAEGGRVEIDYEEIDGVRKLRITDNGIGMTPEEVAENLNRLSASTGVQAFDKNFGIGAKITAAVRNPHGVMYKTWKGGDGALTVLGRIDGRYGRLGFRSTEDASVYYWLPLTSDDKHSIIEDSGVSVVLLGKSAEDDTTLAPAGADLPSQWVAAYLERRYFAVPAGINLKAVREIHDSARGMDRAIYDTIRGQRYYLNKHSDFKGELPLPEVNAKVWWWILSESITEGGKTWNNRGHVAALYQNEIYESRGGSSRLSALKDFGIYAGHSRVVIYVEPQNVLGANTSRSAVILQGGVPIDYASIGMAFADQMPDELSGYMAGQVSSEEGDHRKSIQKNIKEVDEALDQARYRRSTKGSLASVEAVTGDDSGRGDSESTVGGRPSPDSGRPQDAVSRLGSKYLRKAREELERRLRVHRVQADPLPKIVWDEEGTTVNPGRAAAYTRTANLVTVNAKFDFYMNLLEWSLQEAKSRLTSDVEEETLLRICKDEVRRWFEEALCQAVVVLRPMAHDARWGPIVFNTGLSDEGLTAAVVSHRWLLLSAVKRGLAGRLGRLRETSAQSSVPPS